MKRNAFIMGFLVLLAVGILAVFLLPTPKKGAVETFSKLHDSKLGSVYVLGRYDGFLNGWDVAFFHRDGQAQWFGYYLAHEARGWGKVSLHVDENIVIVNDGNKKVAEYDTQSGAFTHKLQGVVYSKKDGLDGGMEVGKWDLPSVQRRD